MRHHTHREIDPGPGVQLPCLLAGTPGTQVVRRWRTIEVGVLAHAALVQMTERFKSKTLFGGQGSCRVGRGRAPAAAIHIRMRPVPKKCKAWEVGKVSWVGFCGTAMACVAHGGEKILIALAIIKIEGRAGKTFLAVGLYEFSLPHLVRYIG